MKINLFSWRRFVKLKMITKINGLKSLCLVTLSLCLFSTAYSASIESYVLVNRDDVLFSGKINNLSSKAQLNTISESVSLMDVLLGVLSFNAPVNQISQVFTENINIGLDYSKTSYAVFSSSFDHSRYSTVYLAVKDFAKLQKNIDNLPHLFFPNTSILTKNGFKVYNIDDYSYLLINKDVCILSIDNHYIDEIIQQPPFVKHLNDFEYAKYLDHSKDLSIAFSKTDSRDFLDRILFPNILDLYQVYTLQFENGVIDICQKFIAASDSSRKALDQLKQAFKVPTHSMDLAIESSPTFSFLTGVNASIFEPLILGLLDNDLIEEEETRLMSQLSSLIEGDMLTVVDNFRPDSYDFAFDVSLMAQGKAKQAFVIASSFLEKNISGLVQMEYPKDEQIKITNKDLVVYLGYKEEIFYVTTDLKLANDPTRDLKSKLIGHGMEIHSENDTFIGELNFPQLVSALSSVKDSSLAEDIVTLFDSYDRLEYAGVYGDAMNIKLSLKNRQINSLAYLAKCFYSFLVKTNHRI